MECFLNFCLFLDKYNGLFQVHNKSVRARASNKSGGERRIYIVGHVKHFITWFWSRIIMMMIKEKKNKWRTRRKKKK